MSFAKGSPWETLRSIYFSIFYFSSFIYTSSVAFAKPNVILFVVDDLRPALGCYKDSNAYTPNVDELAKDSIIFKNAFVQQALCAPSRNSFLTSRRPDSLHLYDFYSYWREAAGNFTTLPQYFRENGYQTVSIGKVFHPGVSSNFSDDQPYSWSSEPYHPPTEAFKEAEVCPGKGTIGKNLVCPVVPELQPGGSLPDLQSTQKALEFLNAASNSSKPFFLAVGYHKPHVPLKYPVKYRDLHPLEKVKLPDSRYRPVDMPTVAWNPWTDVRRRDDIKSLNVSFPFGVIPDDYVKLITQSYHASVSYIDDLIGEMIHQLRSLDLYDNTIILLLGDHGWSLGEHGEWSKFSNFEVAVRVPLIVRVPGLTEGGKDRYKESKALVELVDVFPSLSDLAGLPPLPQCSGDNTESLCTEGVSFLPVIQQLQTSKVTFREWKRGVFSQYPRPGVHPTIRPNSDKPHLEEITIMGYSLRTPRFRYTEWVPFKDLAPEWNSSLAGVELYDHFIDPQEQGNLADRPQLSQLREQLSQQLKAGWRHSLPIYI